MVTPIVSNDGGQGFVVEADGVTLYHSGDHAGWREGEEAAYKDEIDFLEGSVGVVDIAFRNVTGCRFTDRCPLEESNAYMLDKLHPYVMIPTHGLDNEVKYTEAVEVLKSKGYELDAFCPCNKGDHFRYEGRSAHNKAMKKGV